MRREEEYQELRALRAEIERLRADCALRAGAYANNVRAYSEELEKCTGDNERLWADRDGFKDIARNQRKLIEAALAIAENRSLQTTSASVIGEMIKALKGEA